MVDFKIQTSNTSLFFKTTLILNKNITPLDTKMAHSYRWPLLYYGLSRQKNLDFSNFFFICGILGQNQEKVSFLVDPCCSKAPKQAFIELKEKIKLCIFSLFYAFEKYNFTLTNSLMLFKLQNDQKLIHLEEKEVNLLIW